MRAYYSASISEFLVQDNAGIIGVMANNNQFDLTDLQRNTWNYEIKHLKFILQYAEGRILFEYTIPRMGRRADVVLLINNIVFLLEYKVGDETFHKSTIEQVFDYAIDLKNFQKESHNKLIVPIAISTKADKRNNAYAISNDKIMNPICSTGDDLLSIINLICCKCNERAFDYLEWENSIYMPTPTIIEAAQALYRGHSVEEISRSDSGAENLTITSKAINVIIDKSKLEKRKSIIFVTGVPGAGKTLAGLNIANERHKFEEEEHAVFLSGNGPLVEVLQEALARDKKENEGIKKADALRQAESFIQIIHHFRDDCLKTDKAPIEKVVIFDEAQRAWTVEQISKFMKQKKGIPDFTYSEPEFLISTMDRHSDWAVIICLIGGGQEINVGEAGLPEWFDSLKRSFAHWDIYTSNQLYDTEYTRDRDLDEMLDGLNVAVHNKLHLATSIRSFRSEKVSEFVKLILENEKDKARKLYLEIDKNFPIKITRDLNKAKEWIKHTARGSERYGLIASSGALRLKPSAIYVKNEIKASNWFLNDSEDIRSSYYLEDVATEFDIQGLELDYTIVAWDGDFRYNGAAWTCNNFNGSKWQNVNNDANRIYLKNAYRVLLTRARQGMVIFIPNGDESDATRKNEFYDATYQYLKEVGINEI